MNWCRVRLRIRAAPRSREGDAHVLRPFIDEAVPAESSKPMSLPVCLCQPKRSVLLRHFVVSARSQRIPAGICGKTVWGERDGFRKHHLIPQVEPGNLRGEHLPIELLDIGQQNDSEALVWVADEHVFEPQP